MGYRTKWAIWAVLALTIAVGGFALIESQALSDPNGLTLSQLTVNIIYAWPPVVFLFGLGLGLLIGILTTHFLWTWVPLQKRVNCAECGKRIITEGKWP